MGKRREKKRKKLQERLENVVTSSEGATNLHSKDFPFPFSIDELGICLKVLRSISDDQEIMNAPQLRELRKTLDPIVQVQVEKYQQDDLPRPPPRKRQKIENTDEQYINQTKLRAERLKHLEKLNEEGKEEVLRVLDGVGHSHTPDALLLTSGSDQLQLPAGDTSNIDGDVIISESMEDQPDLEVKKAIKCYICKKMFKKLHFYYDQLCPDCADLNYRKRTETVDMTGKVCFVTGARVKIGYRCALKLLRCNAIVIGTTRFPVDAARRFEQEKDFETWKHNLHLFGLDFRNIGALELFCQFLKRKFSRLDVIINNACQTIRRPPAYYQHLLESERSSNVSSGFLLQYNTKFNSDINPSSNSTSKESTSETTIEEVNDTETIPLERNIEKQKSSNTKKSSPMDAITSISNATTLNSADMSQIQLLPEDSNYSKELFPESMTDINEQQVDLRTKNSWMLKLDEVETPELAEVMLINAIAPTIINSKLKPLMEVDPETPKFIVNVSAMEGKFYRYKSDTHPHTNMAKAALNMMTRTSAQDYKKKNIYMTSVDTGWINDEKPLVKAVQHMKKHNFQTPLDEIDAAARVLDPVIAPLLDLAQGRPFNPDWGIFLKDYKKCEW